MPIFASAALIAATASDSAADGARSKLIVTAGNCSWCAIASGAAVCTKRAKDERGTCELAVTALGAEVVLVLVVP